jgi:hypothetical protein
VCVCVCVCVTTESNCHELLTVVITIETGDRISRSVLIVVVVVVVG